MGPVKGDFVECIRCPDGEFTVGNHYSVIAGPGDAQQATSSGLPVQDGGFILIDDFGRHSYCLYPECVFGKWEIV